MSTNELSYEELFPSRYFKQEDLADGPHTLTITRITKETMPKGDTRPVAYFAGNQKGLVLNKLAGKVLVAAYGAIPSQWIGQNIEIFDDPNVMFGSEVTGGIRLRAVPRTKTAQTSAMGTRVDVPARKKKSPAAKAPPPANAEPDFDDDIPI